MDRPEGVVAFYQKHEENERRSWYELSAEERRRWTERYERAQRAAKRVLARIRRGRP